MKKLLLVALGALCIGVLPTAASANVPSSAPVKSGFVNEVSPTAVYVVRHRAAHYRYGHTYRGCCYRGCHTCGGCALFSGCGWCHSPRWNYWW